MASRSISRVLSRVVIHLGGRLPSLSSDHTRGLGGQRHCPPIWSCSGWGLPGQPVTRLPVVSYTTFSPLPRARTDSPSAPQAGHALGADKIRARRYVSVALSLRSPSLGVTQHPALWSPDFPQAHRKVRPRPPDLLATRQYNRAGGRRQNASVLCIPTYSTVY